MKKYLKKVLAIMIVFLLAYQHGIIAINVIAGNIIENTIDTTITEEENNERESNNKAELLRDTICKTDMIGSQYQYKETIKLYKNILASKKIRLSDISNIFLSQENEIDGLKTIYKSTIFNKMDLLENLQNGRIKIKIKDAEAYLIDIR